MAVDGSPVVVMTRQRAAGSGPKKLCFRLSCVAWKMSVSFSNAAISSIRAWMAGISDSVAGLRSLPGTEAVVCKGFSRFRGLLEMLRQRTAVDADRSLAHFVSCPTHGRAGCRFRLYGDRGG